MSVSDDEEGQPLATTRRQKREARWWGDRAILARLGKIEWEYHQAGDMFVAPVRADDAPRIQAFFDRVSPDKIERANRIHPVKGNDQVCEIRISQKDKAWLDEERSKQRRNQLRRQERMEEENLDERAAEAARHKELHRQRKEEERREGARPSERMKLGRERDAAVHAAFSKADGEEPQR